MRTTRVSRRWMLGGIGLGTASLFARPLVRQAFAQGTVPRRLVILCMPNCNIKATWAPTGGRNVPGNSGDATMFSWGSSNSPLEVVRQHTVLIDGLDHKAVGGDPHSSGFIRYSTGGTIKAGAGAGDPGAGNLANDGNHALLPSADQLFLDSSPILGDKSLPIRSLQLGSVSVPKGRKEIWFKTLSYAMPAGGMLPAHMPPEVDPFKTYMRIASDAVPMGNPADRVAAVESQLAKDKSILDFVKADLGRLQMRLPMQQRVKLEDHLSGLREYEQSLTRSGTAGTGPTVKLPGAPPMLDSTNMANFMALCGQYHDLVKLCFQMDITRTVTILYGQGNQSYKSLHSIAHGGSADALSNGTKEFMGMYASFVKLLADAKDIDGTSSLIENTVMTMSSDVSERHNHVNVPYVVWGGAKMGIKGGRLLRYPGGSSNDVFAALAKPLGVNLPGGKFGDMSTGPLPELVT
jgi:hypothetical protein